VIVCGGSQRNKGTEKDDAGFLFVFVCCLFFVFGFWFLLVAENWCFET
jgi:hypothetical protein